jgi:hypothetical protein
MEKLRAIARWVRRALPRAGRFIWERYAGADPRTLGLYRIVIATLLIADHFRYWYFARRYFSNEGVLTNHWHLFKPTTEFNFSLFHAFSSPAEVHVAFALALLCYCFFLVGYKTRVFNVLSLVWVCSVGQRDVMIENGGYVVVHLTVFWAMFLPTGRRFSVDSLLASWRARREGTVEALNDRTRPADDNRPFVSLASLLVLFNFALVYLFNVVNKFGSNWRAGRTVQYVLHIDRMITWEGAWLRELLTPWLARVMTWSVLVLETLIFMTIVWPVARRHARPTAMALCFLLHASFAVLMRLGPFSWFMIGYSTILLTAEHWDGFIAWWWRRDEVVVRFDRRDGLGWWIARLLKRLDGAERITFDVADHARFTAVARGRELSGAAAVWRAARALPGGPLFASLARLLSLGLLDLVVLAAMSRPRAVARFFGLAGPPREAPPRDETPSPWRLALRRRLGQLREVVLVYLLVCLVSQAINENKSIPKQLNHTLPGFMRATIGYPRIFQGWGMFAPNPIREDGSVSVDAITVDGRHVDPFTGLEPDLNLSDARGLGLDQIEQDYFNRIRLDRNKAYRSQLERWILRRHKESGRPEDEVVFFNVWWLRDECPDLGASEPFDHEAICLHSYKKKGYKPQKGLPPLPTPCTPASAEKEDRGADKPKPQKTIWQKLGFVFE